MKKHSRKNFKENAPQKNQLILSLFKQGHAVSEIAFMVGVSRSYAYRITRLPMDDPRVAWVKLDDAEGMAHLSSSVKKELLPPVKSKFQIRRENGKKLTYGLVWKHIREGMSQRSIAEMYGVDDATVSYRKLQKARAHKNKIADVSKKPEKEFCNMNTGYLRDYGLLKNPVKIERIDAHNIPFTGGKRLLARKINEIITYINQMEKNR